jgi:hypothetical protein
MAVSVIE